MNVHFIAIGGSAMHNLAIALSRKGFKITGSDDEIFEPSKSRLEKEGILPKQTGWDANNIHTQLDAVILGMHARADNPELLEALKLKIPIYSYPEYLYEQSKNKKRIVIGGSHGKTTITSMLLHVVSQLNISVDYMVGAQLDGYDCMVRLTHDAPYMILEGDEYLSSPIDLRPKFHLYQPTTALLSGIAWDHINVFPTFENYVDQFRIFCSKIEKGGVLAYNEEDEIVNQLAKEFQHELILKPYKTPNYIVSESNTILSWNGKEFNLSVFGAHNLQNLMGAMLLAESMDISNKDFLTAMETFTGAGKRLEKVFEKNDFVLYKDFAHSPSKLKATTSAVKEKYLDRKLVACMELHTFSSLKKEFLPQYLNAMQKADIAIVYFSPEVVKHKKLTKISKEDVRSAFGNNVMVYTDSAELQRFLVQQKWNNTVLLMMSSGNFDGINYPTLANSLQFDYI
jgi:UDP-N-acetylmuramate: L-alanyl-gamma-D-glutamyl-meso-diaminopimelate ligase